MSRRLYAPDPARTKFLRDGWSGDMVPGMTRKPLFRDGNKPICAVTMPFHDRDALEEVKAILVRRGYDAFLRRRPVGGGFIVELVVGHLKTEDKEN